MRTSTHLSASPGVAQGFTKTKGVHAAVTTPASTPPFSPPRILDLRGSDLGFSLKDELVKGLADGQPRMVPGGTPEDEAFAYTRSINTLCLYSDAGLRIYEDITELKVGRCSFGELPLADLGIQEYYVFGAELEILREFGDEIVRRVLPCRPLYLADCKTCSPGLSNVWKEFGRTYAGVSGSDRRG